MSDIVYYDNYMMNYLEQVKQLRNTYFVIRHGKSLANEEGIILSHPDDGITGYGLVDEGKGQVRKSVEEALKNSVLNKNTIIVSSDFTRALETAEIAREVLGVKDIFIATNLRERFFGDWDKQQNTHYQDVWEDDIQDPGHKKNNVESANEVVERTTRLILQLEEKYTGRNILLVSHGDALQILQTAFERVDASLHRQLPHLETAEIRKLTLK